MRNPFPPHGFHRHALDERRLRLHPVRIFLLEANLLAGAFTASLLTGGAGPADDGALAENFEGIEEHAAETGAVAQEKCYGNDAPGDACHGEETAHAVAAQRHPSFLEDFNQHIDLS